MRTEEQVTQALRDAGCGEAFIAEFLRALAQGSPRQQDRLLEAQRSQILDRVHLEQKKLECFDYFRYQLKKEQEEMP